MKDRAICCFHFGAMYLKLLQDTPLPFARKVFAPLILHIHFWLPTGTPPRREEPLQQRPPLKARCPHTFSLLVQEPGNSQQTDLARAPLSTVSCDRLWHRLSHKLFRAQALLLPSGRQGTSAPLAWLCYGSCPFLALNITFPRQAASTSKPESTALLEKCAPSPSHRSTNPPCK